MAGWRTLFFLAAALLGACSRVDWRTADRSSANIVPPPDSDLEAKVYVFAARAINWRGFFGVHTWIATKEHAALSYTVYQVIGWRKYRGLEVVSVEEDIPDRKWFNAVPELVQVLRGAEAESAIPKIKEAAASYPYKNDYRVWPGPNSNSFVSHIIRNVDELRVELPPTAIGRDWINRGDFFGLTETKTGIQLSVFGLLGFSLGLGEGIEINIIGLTFGVDFLRPALKLPIVGRIGMKDHPPAL